MRGTRFEVYEPQPQPHCEKTKILVLTAVLQGLSEPISTFHGAVRAIHSLLQSSGFLC